MHRDEEYNNLKEEFAQRLLTEGLYRFYPQLKGKVESYSWDNHCRTILY